MKFLGRLITCNNKNSNDKWVKDGKFNYHYVNDDECFSGETIGDIIFHMNYLKKKYSKVNLPVWFEIVHENLKLADKLTYILMECLCYYYLKTEKRNIRLFWGPEPYILTDGVSKSSLIHLNRQFSPKKFIEKFLSDESSTHYRKVYRLSDKEENPFYQSIIQTELDLFLTKMDIKKESSEKISEICAELIGNTFEHAKSDCLIDIDLTDNHSKEEEGVIIEGEFKGVNIAILNFSDKLLFEDIKYKLHNEELIEVKYKKIMEAYKKHVDFFSDKYPEDFFYYLAATQLGISGRKKIQDAGGTGLYVLLQSLIEDSDLSNCYVLSGKHVVIFNEDYLFENEEKW
ncbi:TPA: hypothetical protein ACGO3D_001751, partial [Streptococcus suis]